LLEKFTKAKIKLDYYTCYNKTLFYINIVSKFLILLLQKKKFLFDNPAKPLFNINKKFINLIAFKKYYYGNKNKNKKFLIINRSPGSGLFSNLNFVLNFIYLAKKKKFIPIIDMENFPTIYNDNKKINKTNNSWEYYFKKLNKFKLADIYQSQNVYFTNSHFLPGMSFDSTIPRLRKILKKIKFKQDLISKANNYFNKNFNKEDKILGVHFRGSTYKIARGHQLPATIKIMSEHIKYLIDKYSYNKIFLVTEEQKYLEAIKKQFKNKCYFFPSFRMNKKDSFDIYPRKNHRYKLGYETAIEAIILSKCHGLTYVKSNLILAVMSLSKIKQSYHEILLGFNSRNKFIARWYWYIKSLLPRFLGGLVNKNY
jgi:hypothetical protein